jgi:hypothetical protein
MNPTQTQMRPATVSYQLRNAAHHCAVRALAVLAMVAGFGLLLGVSAQAAVNSPARIQAFAKLPDWQGIWAVTGSTKTFDPSGKPPPYNAEWLAKYTQLHKNKKRVDSLDQYCVAGVPRLTASAYPFMLMITPEETLIHYSHREMRHIWTDGREHPPVDELWPFAWADSIGHWEGETLVIDTISVKPDLWIDSTGATISSQAQIIERISMLNKNHLKNEITINDPTSLFEPWTITRTYKRSSAKELPEEQCNRKASKAGK